MNVYPYQTEEIAVQTAGVINLLRSDAAWMPYGSADSIRAGEARRSIRPLWNGYLNSCEAQIDAYTDGNRPGDPSASLANGRSWYTRLTHAAINGVATDTTARKTRAINDTVFVATTYPGSGFTTNYEPLGYVAAGIGIAGLYLWESLNSTQQGNLRDWAAATAQIYVNLLVVSDALSDTNLTKKPCELRGAFIGFAAPIALLLARAAETDAQLHLAHTLLGAVRQRAPFKLSWFAAQNGISQEGTYNDHNWIGMVQLVYEPYRLAGYVDTDLEQEIADCSEFMVMHASGRYLLNWGETSSNAQYHGGTIYAARITGRRELASNFLFPASPDYGWCHGPSAMLFCHTSDFDLTEEDSRNSLPTHLNGRVSASSAFTGGIPIIRGGAGSIALIQGMGQWRGSQLDTGAVFAFVDGVPLLQRQGTTSETAGAHVVTWSGLAYDQHSANGFGSDAGVSGGVATARINGAILYMNEGFWVRAEWIEPTTLRITFRIKRTTTRVCRVECVFELLDSGTLAIDGGNAKRANITSGGKNFWMYLVGPGGTETWATPVTITGNWRRLYHQTDNSTDADWVEWDVLVGRDTVSTAPATLAADLATITWPS